MRVYRRRRIFVPKSSDDRSGAPQASQRTAKTELKGAEQRGQRLSIAPRH
jgi:hypothetical protein